MKLDDLHNEWDKDQDLKLATPDVAVRDIPRLHSKWWRIYTDEKQRYLLAKESYDTLRMSKYSWYMGKMSDEERIKLGWPPQPIMILRQDIDTYLNVDKDLQPALLKVQNAELKMKFLEDCIKNIGGRPFLLTTYVNWLRFSQGS